MFNNLFFENRPVYEIMSKSVMEPEGPQMTSQHDSRALHARYARLHARTRMHTPTHPDSHTRHAITRARTHTRAHIFTLIAFPWQPSFANAPQCYVMRTSLVLLILLIPNIQNASKKYKVRCISIHEDRRVV